MYRALQYVSLIALALVSAESHAGGNYTERRGQAYITEGILRLASSLKEARLKRETQRPVNQTPAIQVQNSEFKSALKCDNKELTRNFDQALKQLKQAKNLKSPDPSVNKSLSKEKFSDFLKRALGDEAFRLIGAAQLAAIDDRWSEPVEYQQIEMILEYGRHMNLAYEAECLRQKGQPNLKPDWFAFQTTAYIDKAAHRRHVLRWEGEHAYIDYFDLRDPAE